MPPSPEQVSSLDVAAAPLTASASAKPAAPKYPASRDEATCDRVSPTSSNPLHAHAGFADERLFVVGASVSAGMAAGRWLPSTIAALRNRPRRLARQSGVCEAAAECVVVEVEQRDEIERVRLAGGANSGSRRVRGLAVPRADVLADVAAEDPVAEARAQLGGIGRAARSSGS